MIGYVDPGSFGLISQLGYILLFSVLSVFLFFWRVAKNVLSRVTHLMAEGVVRLRNAVRRG